MNLFDHIVKAAGDLKMSMRYNYDYPGNFSKPCVGVVCPSHMILNQLQRVITISLHDAAMENPEEHTGAFAECINNFLNYKVEQMGHNVIIYWPSIIQPK